MAASTASTDDWYHREPENQNAAQIAFPTSEHAAPPVSPGSYADSSAVIDMGTIGDDNGSNNMFSDRPGAAPEESSMIGQDNVQSGYAPANDDTVHQRKAQTPVGQEDVFANNMSQMVWQAGKQQASKAISLYANIDILRPYFDVTPQEVRQRLIYSFIPSMPKGQPLHVDSELYGPSMILLTLVAALIFGMKNAEHVVQDGTLMGTAMAVCFGYWLGVSSIVYCVAYICSILITPLQVASMLGYGLFGHCLVILANTLVHPSSHAFFYAMSLIMGGLSTLKMVSILVSRSHNPTQRLTVAATVAVLHLGFLLYLHFAYHKTVQEFSSETPGVSQHSSVDVLNTE